MSSVTDNSFICSQLEPVPPPGELIKMYEALDKNGPLPIQWNWPHGRRAPTDTSGFIEEDDEEAIETKYVVTFFSLFFFFYFKKNKSMSPVIFRY